MEAVEIIHRHESVEVAGLASSSYDERRRMDAWERSFDVPPFAPCSSDRRSRASATGWSPSLSWRSCCAFSGSSTAVGGVLLLRLLPAAAAAPFAACGVRGWDRRRTMQAADLVRAGIVVAIPLVAALWWVYVCASARSGGHRVPARTRTRSSLTWSNATNCRSRIGDPRVFVRVDPIRRRGVRRGGRAVTGRRLARAATRSCWSSSSTQSRSSCRSCSSHASPGNRRRRSPARLTSHKHASVMHYESRSYAW